MPYAASPAGRAPDGPSLVYPKMAPSGLKSRPRLVSRNESQPFSASAPPALSSPPTRPGRVGRDVAPSRVPSSFATVSVRPGRALILRRTTSRRPARTSP